MTPEEPESRRIAEELARRERRRPGTEALADPATIAALLEKHEGEVARIIGQAEEALAQKIDTLANSQGAAAEGLRREIAEGMKGDRAEGIAAMERSLREEQRVALASLSKGLKQEFEALKTSLDTREGGVFAEIDRVAEKVMPSARALGQLQHAVAGTAAAARDMAAVRDAVVDSRQSQRDRRGGDHQEDRRQQRQGHRRRVGDETGSGQDRGWSPDLERERPPSAEIRVDPSRPAGPPLWRGRGLAAAGNRHLDATGRRREPGTRRVLGAPWRAGHRLSRHRTQIRSGHGLHDRGHGPVIRKGNARMRQGSSGK